VSFSNRNDRVSASGLFCRVPEVPGILVAVVCSPCVLDVCRRRLERRTLSPFSACLRGQPPLTLPERPQIVVIHLLGHYESVRTTGVKDSASRVDRNDRARSALGFSHAPRAAGVADSRAQVKPMKFPPAVLHRPRYIDRKSPPHPVASHGLAMTLLLASTLSPFRNTAAAKVRSRTDMPRWCLQDGQRTCAHDPADEATRTRSRSQRSHRCEG